MKIIVSNVNVQTKLFVRWRHRREVVKDCDGDVDGGIDSNCNDGYRQCLESEHSGDSVPNAHGRTGQLRRRDTGARALTMDSEPGRDVITRDTHTYTTSATEKYGSLLREYIPTCAL